MKKKVFIIINEQHSMMDSQLEVIRKAFPYLDIAYKHVPATGWTLTDIRCICTHLIDETVVFVSPIPAMIKILMDVNGSDKTFVMHNDKREKKELPNGKVIMTVAKTGWQLV